MKSLTEVVVKRLGKNARLIFGNNHSNLVVSCQSFLRSFSQKKFASSYRNFTDVPGC